MLTFSQCIIPVIEDLLPPAHNAIMLDMLFSLAKFHTFAKMHLHTEQMLELFDQSIIKLSEDMQKFKTVVCAAYESNELLCKTAEQGHYNCCCSYKG